MLPIKVIYSIGALNRGILPRKATNPVEFSLLETIRMFEAEEGAISD